MSSTCTGYYKLRCSRLTVAFSLLIALLLLGSNSILHMEILLIVLVEIVLWRDSLCDFRLVSGRCFIPWKSIDRQWFYMHMPDRLVPNAGDYRFYHWLSGFDRIPVVHFVSFQELLISLNCCIILCIFDLSLLFIQRRLLRVP